MVEVDELQELKDIFNIIDRDKNGLIGYADLKATIANSGYIVSASCLISLGWTFPRLILKK